MKVATILQLAASGELKVGNNVSVEGYVTWKADPKAISGVSNGEAYSFLAQKVLVKDAIKGDDGIFVDLTFRGESQGLQSTGHFISATGKLGSYTSTKDGSTKFSVERAKLTDERSPTEVKQTQQNAQQAVGQINALFGGEQKVRYDADREARICRQNALSAAAGIVGALSLPTEANPVEAVLNMAEQFSAWTITGERPVVPEQVTVTRMGEEPLPF